MTNAQDKVRPDAHSVSRRGLLLGSAGLTLGTVALGATQALGAPMTMAMGDSATETGSGTGSMTSTPSKRDRHRARSDGFACADFASYASESPRRSRDGRSPGASR